MTNEIALVVSTISIFGIVILFYVFYRDYRTDLFRERLFTLRDRLFALAEDGDVPFGSNAYGLLRSIINSTIRNGHTCGLIELYVYSSIIKNNPEIQASSKRFRSIWEKSLMELPEETQKELISIRGELHYLVAEQVLFTSAFLMLLILPVVLYAVLRIVKISISKLANRVFTKDRLAVITGYHDTISILTADEPAGLSLAT